MVWAAATGLQPPGRARLAATALFALAACVAPPDQTPSPAPEPAPGRAFAVGDIEPDAPLERIRLLQPLADLVAARLAPLGIERGRVVAARSLEEMARLMREGRVDAYVDSPFPGLFVRKASGAHIALVGRVEGAAEYWSVFFARRSEPIHELRDLRGRVLALQERHSTSGYVLPAGTLLQRGFQLRHVDGPDAAVADDQIGFLLSRDEENTVEMVINGSVPAGAVSNQILDDLPAELREQLRVLDRTIAVPRRIVLLRRDLDPALDAAIRAALLDLDEEDNRGGWTWSFEPLEASHLAALEQLEPLMALVP